MPVISNEQTVASDRVQDLKGFNTQSLATQTKKGEQLFSMTPVFTKSFILLGDNIVELSTENESLKKKLDL